MGGAYNFKLKIVDAQTLTNKNASALNPWYFMKVSTTGFDVWNGSGAVVGVLSYNTNHDALDVAKITAGTLTEGQTDTGKPGTIISQGRAYVKVAAGGTATKYGKIALASTNNGLVTDWVSGNECYGYFLEAGTAGDTVEAYISIANGVAIGAAGQYAEYNGASGHTAITPGSGFAFLSKSSAGTYTLAVPTMPGLSLKIRANTAQAHTLDAASPYFYTNGTAGSSSTNLATFGGAIGDGLDLESIEPSAGVYAWNIVRSVNITLS